MDSLRPDQLMGVAALWRATGRELETSFSGVSMRPTIEPGQMVRLRCTDQLSIGNIVAVARGEEVIVHRLVASSPHWLLFRGDANMLPDAPLFDSIAVIGLVESVRQSGGEFSPPAQHRPSAAARAATALIVATLSINTRLGHRLAQLSIASRRLLIALCAALRSR